MRRPTVEDAEIAFVRVAGFLFELADDIEEWCRDTFQRKKQPPSREPWMSDDPQ